MNDYQIKPFQEAFKGLGEAILTAFEMNPRWAEPYSLMFESQSKSFNDTDFMPYIESDVETIALVLNDVQYLFLKVTTPQESVFENVVVLNNKKSIENFKIPVLVDSASLFLSLKNPQNKTEIFGCGNSVECHKFNKDYDYLQAYLNFNKEEFDRARLNQLSLSDLKTSKMRI